MRVKTGASIVGCKGEILTAAILIEPIFAAHGVELVITSGSENYKHSAERSYHYSKMALDLRSRDLSESDQLEVLQEIKAELGEDFVVLLESNHYHVHFAPVYHAISN